MPTLCCVPNCSRRGGHQFPKEPNLRKLWIIAVRRGEPGWEPSVSTKVCAVHFSPEDYETHTVDCELCISYFKMSNKLNILLLDNSHRKHW